MAHRRVVRTKMLSMRATENVAHLVPARGVVRAESALCGSRVREEEFWEKAAKKIPTCVTCRNLNKK